MSTSIQAVVLGASGYVGGELLRLIAAHPDFSLAAAVSDSRADTSVAETFGHLSQALSGVHFVARDSWHDEIKTAAALRCSRLHLTVPRRRLSRQRCSQQRKDSGRSMLSTHRPIFAMQNNRPGRTFTVPLTEHRHYCPNSPARYPNTEMLFRHRTSDTPAVLRQRLCLRRCLSYVRG